MLTLRAEPGHQAQMVQRTEEARDSDFAWERMERSRGAGHPGPCGVFGACAAGLGGPVLSPVVSARFRLASHLLGDARGGRGLPAFTPRVSDGAWHSGAC